MAEFWIHVDESVQKEKRLDLLRRHARGCDVAVASKEDAEACRNAGAIVIAGKEDADIKILDDLLKAETEAKVGPQVALRLAIKSREDEEKAVDAAGRGIGYLVVECPNWKIIPLENLIAKLHQTRTRLIASVKTAEEARTAIETLELGVDGVLLESSDEEEFVKTSALIKGTRKGIKLVEAEVVDKKSLTLGARVCIDTCNIMTAGEGLLVGSQSSGLFLVQAEVLENPHVEPRPFRVNAGPISSYILKPDGKTQYLSELKAGDEVLIVNRHGESRSGSVGRVKIEMRPQLLVEAKYHERTFKVILQNAETIHLVTKEGSESVVDLKPHDRVLIRFEEGGRHFGMLVEGEMVIER